MLSFPVFKLLCIVAFYVSLNFTWQIIPLLVIGGLHYKIWWCQIVLLLAIVDMFVPLKSKPHGCWNKFTNLCNVSKGGEEYNQVEVIVEGEAAYDRRKNYLLCHLPHSLYM